MGIYTNIIFLDEFNWDYKNYSKDKFKKEIYKIYPKAVLLADWYTGLIFDINKQSIHKLDKYDLCCDLIYYVHDIDYLNYKKYRKKI